MPAPCPMPRRPASPDDPVGAKEQDRLGVPVEPALQGAIEVADDQDLILGPASSPPTTPSISPPLRPPPQHQPRFLPAHHPRHRPGSSHVSWTAGRAATRRTRRAGQPPPRVIVEDLAGIVVPGDEREPRPDRVVQLDRRRGAGAHGRLDEQPADRARGADRSHRGQRARRDQRHWLEPHRHDVRLSLRDRGQGAEEDVAQSGANGVSDGHGPADPRRQVDHPRTWSRRSLS